MNKSSNIIFLLVVMLSAACAHPTWVIRKTELGDDIKTGTVTYEDNRTYREALRQTKVFCGRLEVHILEEGSYYNRAWPKPYLQFICYDEKEQMQNLINILKKAKKGEGT